MKSGTSPRNTMERITICGIIVLLMRVISIALRILIDLFQSANARAVLKIASHRM
jgi:hypothetical protein